MRTNMYCIYDTVAEEIFGGIIRANNDEVARRSFYEALADQNGPLAKNARDYQLMQIGIIDTEAVHIYSPNGDSLDHLANIIATGADWLDANKETK